MEPASETHGPMFRFLANLFTLALLAAIVLIGVFSIASVPVPPGFVALRKTSQDAVSLLPVGRQWMDPFGILAEVALLPVSPHSFVESEHAEGSEGKISVPASPGFDFTFSDGRRFRTFLRFTMKIEPVILSDDGAIRSVLFEHVKREGMDQLWRNTESLVVRQVREALEKHLASEVLDRQRFHSSTLPQIQKQLDLTLQSTGFVLEQLSLGPLSPANEEAQEYVRGLQNESQQEAFGSQIHRLDLDLADMRVRQAELQGTIETLRVVGAEKSKSVVREAELYKKQKELEGDLLVQKAQTDLDQQLAAILASHDDAELYFATVLVPLLSRMERATVAGASPLDVNMWLDALGARINGNRMESEEVKR